MALESLIIAFTGCIIFTVLAGLVASGCSCYFPWLLSWRAYHVVKSEHIRKFMILRQLNRNKSTRTADEDRNKMAFVGCVMWAAVLIFTVATWPVLIFLIILRLFLPDATMMALGDQVDPYLLLFFNPKYIYFTFSMPLFYLPDYLIGKWIYFRKH